MPSTPKILVGNKFSMNIAILKERTRDEPLKPWIKGDVDTDRTSQTSIVFEFNKERRGWHYGWASNKHTCNVEHCLQCYVFELIEPPDTMVCRSV